MIKKLPAYEYEQLSPAYKGTKAGRPFILARIKGTMDSLEQIFIELTEYSKDIAHTQCQYESDNHPMKQHSGYVFTDHDHGIPEIRICRYHYAQHILKYYPDSLVAKHIRSHPDEYKPEEPDRIEIRGKKYKILQSQTPDDYDIRGLANLAAHMRKNNVKRSLTLQLENGKALWTAYEFHSGNFSKISKATF